MARQGPTHLKPRCEVGVRASKITPHIIRECSAQASTPRLDSTLAMQATKKRNEARNVRFSLAPYCYPSLDRRDLRAPRSATLRGDAHQRIPAWSTHNSPVSFTTRGLVLNECLVPHGALSDACVAHTEIDDRRVLFKRCERNDHRPTHLVTLRWSGRVSGVKIVSRQGALGAWRGRKGGTAEGLAHIWPNLAQVGQSKPSVGKLPKSWPDLATLDHCLANIGKIRRQHWARRWPSSTDAACRPNLANAWPDSRNVGRILTKSRPPNNRSTTVWQLLSSPEPLRGQWGRHGQGGKGEPGVGAVARMQRRIHTSRATTKQSELNNGVEWHVRSHRRPDFVLGALPGGWKQIPVRHLQGHAAPHWYG